MAERRSNKHSPRLDEQLEHEVRSLTQGQPVEARSREDLLQEGPLSDAATRPDRPGTPSGLSGDDIALRSLLATSVRPSVFPADRDDLLSVAAEEYAPEAVLDLLERLPAGISWDRLEQVWEAAGGSTEHRAPDPTGGSPDDRVPDATEESPSVAAGAAPTDQALATRPAATDQDHAARPVAERPAADGPEPVPAGPSPIGTEREPAPARSSVVPRPAARPPGVPIEAVLPGLALLDAVTRPGTSWDEIGESRNGWLARILLIPGLGAWRYATSVKPRLRATERARNPVGG